MRDFLGNRIFHPDFKNKETFRMEQYSKEEICTSYTLTPKKECIVLVGLPARGKSYISKMLCRYLNWTGCSTKIFNLGDYKREIYGNMNCRHDFFDPKNKEAKLIRNEIASKAIKDMISWLKLSTSCIAIYDATNTELSRRKMIFEKCKDENIRVFFIESICNQQEIIDNNIMSFKLKSKDYIDFSPDEIYDDFIKRIKNYEINYTELGNDNEGHLSYMKIYNTGKQYYINMIKGFYQPRIVYYLMNTHLNYKEIYLTRHGESEFNQKGILGGNSNLSSNGEKYAKMLGDFVKKLPKQDIRVWTSKLKRTIQTSSYISKKRLELKALDEINAGTCEGMTYEQIQTQYPDEYKKRKYNKYFYRYSMGESYADLVTRLETVILELERQHNTLVIAHQAIVRCIIAYFCDVPAKKSPYISVPLHTLFKITPNAYGCEVKQIHFDLEKNEITETNGFGYLTE